MPLAVGDWKTVSNPNELLELRKSRLYEAKCLLDRADEAKRELNSDETRQYEALFSDAQAMRERAEKLITAEARRKTLDDALEDLGRSQGRLTPAVNPAQALPIAGGDGYSASSAPYEFTFSRRGQDVPTKVTFARGSPGWERHQPQYRRDLAAWWNTGRIGAALQTDISSAGGYMVLPEQFVAELLKNVDNILWMRKLCRLFTTNAQTLGVVMRTAYMQTFAWGAELSTPAPDTALTYGKRTLTPHYMTGELLVSRDLLRSSLLPIEDYIRYEFARDSGYLEETAFQTGTGAGQPLGIFTASNDGIDTSRDVSTGNTTTSIGADNLRVMKYTLKPQYRDHPSLRWLFHRTTVSLISRLKDGMGRYLWRDGIQLGDPDSILNIPVVESEFTPNTYTANQYVGALGAFYWYWICDSLEADMQVLVEKYAEQNQVAYIGRRKTDGMPQLAEAFVRCQLS